MVAEEKGVRLRPPWPRGLNDMKLAALSPTLALMALSTAHSPGLVVSLIGRREGSLGLHHVLDRNFTRVSCVDHPASWADAVGNDCDAYENLELCTADGASGFGWNGLWGELVDVIHGSHTGLTACCTCGGGRLWQKAPRLWRKV